MSGDFWKGYWLLVLAVTIILVMAYAAVLVIWAIAQRWRRK